jgi:hypothetical protein
MRKYLLAIAYLIGVSTLAVAAGPPSVAAREGVVLLTNGEILCGTIIPAGDRYDVHLDSGEISLRRADIAAVCQTVEECYHRKRADIDLGRAQDHLQLAEWCVRNRLFNEAERELADARKADPSHPKIRLIAARLQLGRSPLPNDPDSDPSGKVVPAVATAPLETGARNLPPGTMETFTNTIQPLLLNNCSKSGCHASRSEAGFKLERMHPRFVSRSATQRNLEQVLALVNRDDPPQSALLQTPIRAHANVKLPIFTDRQQGQYRQLVQWVYAVAGSRTYEPTPSLAERTSPLLQNVPGASGALPSQGGPSVGAAELEAELPAVVLPADAAELSTPGAVDPPRELPPERGDDAQALDPTASQKAYTPEQLRALGLDPTGLPADEVPGAVQRGPVRRENPHVQRGAKTAAGFMPRDEFDPEIFNRRYFSQ